MSEQTTFEAYRRIAIELAALSESGLAYCTDPFDIGRFHRVGARSRELMQHLAGEPLDEYDAQIASAAGYATPKIDVRGGVFDQEGHVLLVREIADCDRWTLPGGWCDVLETPRQTIEREVEEEAGFAVHAVHLAAVIDREQWPHSPAYDRHIYNLLFVCQAQGVIDLSFTGDETSQVGWFSIDDLPPLSIARVLPEQIALLHQHWQKLGPAFVD